MVRTFYAKSPHLFACGRAVASVQGRSGAIAWRIAVRPDTERTAPTHQESRLDRAGSLRE
jgi:hypothetical protein